MAKRQCKVSIVDTDGFTTVTSFLSTFHTNWKWYKMSRGLEALVSAVCDDEVFELKGEHSIQFYLKDNDGDRVLFLGDDDLRRNMPNDEDKPLRLYVYFGESARYVCSGCKKTEDPKMCSGKDPKDRAMEQLTKAVHKISDQLERMMEAIVAKKE